MTRKQIAFVTNELYPLSAGGIGRMMFNFARLNDRLGRPADLHFIVPPDLLNTPPGNRRVAEEALGGLATLHEATPLHLRTDETAHLADRASYLPWSLELLWSTSYRYLRCLQELEHRLGQPLDVIEFPDFGGWGLATVEAKRSGQAFQNTLITARLHSTQGVISRAERFFDPSAWNGILLDAERHLLTHADLIIGHEPAIVAHNAAHYGLATRWQGRTITEFPPVELDGETRPAPPPGQDRDLLFSSRLQPFKRPDLFVRAAVAYVEAHPAYTGTCRIASYGWDEDYIKWLQALVPTELSDRVRFIFDATPEQRADWIGKSIVVVPSDYESFCLFAYEAGQMGRPVVLNSACLAFGEGQRWREGENCLMFDGTVTDLVQVLEAAQSWTPTTGVDVAPDRPYWAADLPSPNQATTAPPPSLAIHAIGLEHPSDFDRQFAALAYLDHGSMDDATRPNIHMALPRGIFAPDGPEARRAKAQGWSVTMTSGMGEDPETLRARLCSDPAEAVLLLPLGHELAPGFLEDALTAMTHDPTLDVVAGHVAEVADDSGAAADLRVYGGEMPSLALTSGRVFPMSSLIRTRLFDRVPLDPRALDHWFEVFARDAVLADARVAVLPRIAAHLSGRRRFRIDNSRWLSAGVFDPVGLKAGLSPRLLGMVPSVPLRSVNRAMEWLAEDPLHRATRLLPATVDRDFNPVAFLEDHNGLLVHPLDGEVTIAELTLNDINIARVCMQVRSINPRNRGVAVALGHAPHDASPDAILRAFEDPYRIPRGFGFSGWQHMQPGDTIWPSVTIGGSGTDTLRLLMLSHVPADGSEAFAHPVFNALHVFHAQGPKMESDA